MPLSTAPYVVVDDGTGYRISLDERILIERPAGEVQCSAASGRLACVDTDENGSARFLLGRDGEPAVAIHIAQSFFDNRPVQGPPRWTTHGHLWLQFEAGWERRPVFAPRAREPLSAAERRAAVARIRSKLPAALATRFRALDTLAVGALWTEPVSAEEAHRLWQELGHRGLSRVVVPTAMLQKPASVRRLAENLARAETLPVRALWELRDAVRRAWDAETAADHPDDRGHAPDREWVEAARRGQIELPAVEDERREPVFVEAAETLARYQGDAALRVVAIEGEDDGLWPMLLGFGAFNDCPPPYQHAIVIRDWQQRFGARLVYLSHDSLELTVARPPSEVTAIAELAWSQLLYDADAESVEALADTIRSPYWFFWWD